MKKFLMAILLITLTIFLWHALGNLAKVVNLINTELTWKAFFGLGFLLPPKIWTAIGFGLKGIRP